MRIFVIKQDTDLKGLSESLLKRADKPNAASLERLRVLNPHLDENKVVAGTVVLVPDTPEINTGKAEPVASSGLELLERELSTALAATGKRLREALSRREAQDKEMAKTIKSAALTRLAADDSELRRRFEETSQQATANAKQAKQASADYDAMQESFVTQLSTLRKLLER